MTALERAKNRIAVLEAIKTEAERMIKDLNAHNYQLDAEVKAIKWAYEKLVVQTNKPVQITAAPRNDY